MSRRAKRSRIADLAQQATPGDDIAAGATFDDDIADATAFDDDPAPAAAAAASPKVAPDALAGAIALRRAVPARILRRFRRGASTALVIQAPSGDWCGALREAATAVLGPGRSVAFSHTADGWAERGRLYFVRRAADRHGRPDQSGDGLAACLSGGGSAIGIAPDPVWLPRQLTEAADACIEIAPLRGRDVARVIRATTRCTRCPRVDDALAAALSPVQLALAIRATTTPAACLRRLHAIAARASASGAAVNAPPLEDLAGYGEARDWGLALKADIENRRADPSAASLDALARSLLLAGPPGTGKTLFAAALAKSCGIPLICTSYADWQNGDAHLGIVMQNLRSAFASARGAARASNVGAILFIDELDSIPSRGSPGDGRSDNYFNSLVNALLTLTEKNSPARKGVILIGATNHPGRIDPALLRPGRFDRTILLAPPDAEAFAAMLRTHLGGDLAAADLAGLARLAPGRTGADAAKIVRDARQIARIAGRPLAYDDIVAQILPPETRSRSFVLATARHEAAHAVAGIALGVQRLESVTLCAPDAEGAANFSRAADRPRTRSAIEAMVVAGLAGRAADAMFGEANAGAGGGRGSDLTNASALLAAAHASLGLGGTLLSLGEPADAVALLRTDPGLRAAVEADLQHLYARARDLVRERRTEIEMVAAALQRRRFLTGDEVRALLTRVRAADATRLAKRRRAP